MKKTTQTASDIIFNIVIPIILIIFAILAIILPICLDNYQDYYSETIISSKENGSQVVGYSIDGLKNITRFEYVNHFPNTYVMPNEIGDNALIENTSSLTPATYGSLQFVIYDFDKNDKDVKRKLSNNPYYSATTKSSLLTLYIPYAFSSATIWVDDEYYTSIGPINKTYNPNDYSNLDKPLNLDYQSAAPSRIACILPSSYNELTGDPIADAKVITIHYTAKRGVNFKNNIPLVGGISAITKSCTVRFSACLASIIIITVLLLTSAALLILKLYIEKLPYIGIVFSALLINIAQFVSYNHNIIIAKYIILISLSLLIFFTLLSCKPKTKKLGILWKITLGLSVINLPIIAVLGFSSAFMTAVWYSRIMFITLIVLEHIFVIASIKHSTLLELIGIIITLAVPILALFFNFSLIWFVNPTCLLVNVSAFVLVCYLIGAIRHIELKNKKLTDNLMAEVATQTHSLHAAIEDREMLLSFLSHDLRKASITISTLSDQIIADKDRVNSPIAQKIHDKNNVILSSLSEISAYMKNNISAEAFQTIKISKIFKELESELSMDCEAYGIKLICEDTKYQVRGKLVSLKAIMSNLVFNAIEHAECKNITVKAKAVKDKIQISVHDDGKGLQENQDIFSPFVTSNDDGSNMGLGLFLIKSEIEAMGGTIEYKFDKGAKFTISLLREY